MGKHVVRKERIIRVTGDQRDHIDPHQIAQILIDLLGLVQVEALAEEAERSGRSVAVSTEAPCLAAAGSTG